MNGVLNVAFVHSPVAKVSSPEKTKLEPLNSSQSDALEKDSLSVCCK